MDRQCLSITRASADCPKIVYLRQSLAPLTVVYVVHYSTNTTKWNTRGSTLPREWGQNWPEPRCQGVLSYELASSTDALPHVSYCNVKVGHFPSTAHQLGRNENPGCNFMTLG